MSAKKLNTVFAIVLFASLLAACGGTPPAEPTAAPATAAPTQSAFANPEIPFEAVVQIWAMYYDEVGELQIGWTGSGTIISPDGLILSNAHVVLPDRFFPVDKLVVAMTLSQDQEPEPRYYAEVLQADATLDIAVIRVIEDYDGNAVDRTALNLPFVPFGDSDQLNLGDEITILGYPGIGGETVTLTRGEVSGFTSQPDFGARAFIKTSATIAGGNSGGLAVDATGHLIGIPTQLGYGGDDQFVDCRVLVDTNRDGFVDDSDTCVPTGGFINALRPVALAVPLVDAAQRGEVSIIGAEEPETVSAPLESGSFDDDFSDENSGWSIFTEESGSAYYSNGEYFVEDISGDPYYTALGNFLFENVEVSVDFRFDQGNGLSEIDFACRYVDVNNGYEFRVLNDGNVGISKWLGGEYVSLTDPLQTNIEFGNSVHEAQIVCDGNYLGMRIDGELVVDTFDDSFVSGDVGFAVYSYEDTGVFVAAFDNFQANVLSGQEASTDGEVVVFDDFSDPSSGWVDIREEETSRYYSDGRYYMEVNPSQSTTGDYLLQDFENVVINVDVNIEQPAHDGDIGIICRLIDGDNYYALEVSEDGYYTIWKVINGEFAALLEWTSSSLIPTDGSPFVLNAACDGAQLSIAINGEVLGTATDTDLSSGYPGLIAGTYENGGLVVSFDNFEVIEY